MIAKPKPAHGILYAHGGPEVTTRSRFLKTADVFRTDTEKTNFKKVGKMSKQANDKSAAARLPKRGDRK